MELSFLFKLFILSVLKRVELSDDAPATNGKNWDCHCETAELEMGRRSTIDQELEYPFLSGRCSSLKCLWRVHLDLAHLSQTAINMQSTGEVLRFILPNDFQGRLVAYDGRSTSGTLIGSFNCKSEPPPNLCSSAINGVSVRVRSADVTFLFDGRRANRSAVGANIIIQNIHGVSYSDDVYSEARSTRGGT